MPPRRAKGFTLIELLVVIAIIAVLMGLAFPAYQGVLERSKKVQAKNDVTQIVAAVSSYYTDYGKYPLDDIKQGCDTLLGNPGGSYDNAYVCNVLRAISDSNWNAGNKLNPKAVVFLQGSYAKDATNPRQGFASQDATSASSSPIKQGAFVDPWGDEYLVYIDGDYDGWTQDFIAYSDLGYPNKVTSTCAGTWPAVSAAVFAESWGKDGKQGIKGDQKFKGSDDVISWQ